MPVRLQPQECWNYLESAGYALDQSSDAREYRTKEVDATFEIIPVPALSEALLRRGIAESRTYFSA